LGERCSITVPPCPDIIWGTAFLPKIFWGTAFPHIPLDCTTYYYYYIRLTVLFFQDSLGKPAAKKVNHSGFYMKQEMMGGSGISWTICKSFAHRCRQITTPLYSKLVLRVLVDWGATTVQKLGDRDWWWVGVEIFQKSMPVFTTRCTIVQSVILRSHVVCLSVCPSVCDVGRS